MDSAEILALLARTLARKQAAGEPEGHLAARLCEACTEILGADAGALTISSATERLTVRTAEFPFMEFEDLQDVLGEGPAQHALAEQRPVIMHLGEQDDDAAAFPVLSSMASDMGGPLSVYAVPMRPGGRVVGALTLYVRTGGLARSLEEAQFLADAAGAALLGDPGTTDIDAQPSWAQRARVHQATGLVVAQLGIAPADAMAVLRAHAFGRASNLDSVVADVLDRRLSFSYDQAEKHADVDGIISKQHPRTEEP